MGQVALLDLGVGNILSIKRGLERNGLTVKATSEASELVSSSGIVIPGVGNFGFASKVITKHKEWLLTSIDNGIFVLGVCLGMQILGEGSEEAPGNGLGIIKGTYERFNGNVSVPHMGWNTVSIKQTSEYFEGIPNDAHFYFVHSYFRPCLGTSDEIGVTSYGEEFVSVIEQGNVIGTQFHPEKSGRTGSIFLSNFAQMLKR